jgi:uncharacterized protein YjiK
MTMTIDATKVIHRIFPILLAGLTSLLPLSAAEKPSKGSGYQNRPDDRKNIKLEADQIWQVELPNRRRFDASGLVIYQNKVLTINDRASELWSLNLNTNGTAALQATGWFTMAQLLDANGGREPQHDCEGIAVDAAGNLYICEEKDRAIYRFNPEKNKVEKLAIDWTPVRKFFSKLDDNASFEGIATGGGKLWVANERSDPRIIVVNLESLHVEENFFVDSSTFAFGGPHYTDLSWFDDHLFVLDRNHRSIFEVEPATKKVLAEYSFADMELQPDLAYQTEYPTGTMEGLAIDKEHFWLITDNNGRARFKYRLDARPTLFRCKRPK